MKIHQIIQIFIIFFCFQIKIQANISVSSESETSVNCPSEITLYDPEGKGFGDGIVLNVGPNGIKIKVPHETCLNKEFKLSFDANVVNDDWVIAATQNSALGIYPGYENNGYYEVDGLLLGAIGYGGISLMNPCGQFYILYIEWECCPELEFTVIGDTEQSCENLYLDIQGGVAPYQVQISGTGSQGTVISQNQQNVTMSGLQPSETVTLTVLITDADGCTWTYSVNYERCPKCVLLPNNQYSCECGRITSFNWFDEDCSLRSVSVNPGCMNPTLFIYNSFGNLIISGLLSNSFLDVATLAINNAGNGTYQAVVKCDCGWTNVRNFTVGCSKFKENDTSYGNDNKSSGGTSNSDWIKFEQTIFFDNINCLINSKKETTCRIDIISSSGQMIWNEDRNVFNGDNFIQIYNVSHLSSGMYIARVMIDGLIYNQKLIKP